LKDDKKKGNPYPNELAPQILVKLGVTDKM